MSKCIHCRQNEGIYPFRVLDIQTLHVRDISGEKYVQAMGTAADYTVCRDCAQRYINEASSFGTKHWKKLIPAGLLIVFGVLYMALTDFEIFYMNLLGPLAIFCALALIYTVIKDYRGQKLGFSGLSPEEALKQAAWLQLLDSLPRKNEDQDVTYIPIDGKTKGMSLQQLSSTYDLLPAIAKQVKAELAKNAKS